MAQQPPVFTDVNAYSRAVPGTPRVADASPAYDALGQVGDAMMGLAKVFYEQDQEHAVLEARTRMADQFAALRKQLEGETSIEAAHQRYEEGAAKIYAEADGKAMDARTQGAIRGSYAEMYQETQADVGRQVTMQRSGAFFSAVDARIAQLQRDAPTDPDLALAGSKTEVRGLVRVLVETGMMSAAGAERYQRKALEALDYTRASRMVDESPEQAREVLMAPAEDGSGFAMFRDLEADQRQVLMAQASAQVEVRTANIASLQLQRDDRMWSGTGDGEAFTQAAHAAGMTPDRSLEWQKTRQATLEAKSEYDTLRFLPPGEWDARLVAFDQKAALPGNEDYRGAARRLRRETAALRQRWMDDPAAVADEQFAQGSPSQGMEELPLAAKMAHRRTVLDTMRLTGVTVAGGAPAQERLLTKAEMQGNLTTLQDAPAPQKRQLFKTMRDSMGSYADLGFRQMHREGGLPVAYVHMADRSVPDTGIDLLSRTVDAPLAELIQKLPNKAQDREQIEQAVRRDFEASVGRTFADPEAARERLEMTVKAALHHGGTVSPDEAVRRAKRDLWGHVQQVGTARLPSGVTAEGKAQIAESLEHELARIERHEPVGEDAQHLERVRSEGRWFTYAGRDGDAEGVELRWEGEPVMDSSGRPVRVRFDDIQAGNVPDKRTWEERGLASFMRNFYRRG